MLKGDSEQLIPFLTLGLFGAAHCAGMCGGFAIAVTAASKAKKWRALRRQLMYVSGKAMTYACLGVLLATAGQFVAPSDGLESFRRGLALLTGAMMVLFGVKICRAKSAGDALRLGRFGRVGVSLKRGVRFAQRLFIAARDLPGDAGALATGMVTGLLPCGLSWGALALATTQEPVIAFAGMLLFGLGTAPVLIVVGLGWRGFSTRLRFLAARAGGPLLIAFGLYTAARGAELFGLETGAALILPECCAEQADPEHLHQGSIGADSR
ncbi:MAG: sulfite exporter TauE/SafE [Planctomycetota bacterium]|jgi:sulfite exporter TauE/SafE